MTPCAVPLDRLSAYVDGELPAGEELAVRRHLDVCPACAITVESLLTVKDAVAASTDLRAVPHTLRERLASVTVPASPERRLTARIVVAAGVLVIVSLTVWMRAPQGVPDHVTETLVADHLHFLQEPAAIEIASNDPELVAASLREKVGFPFTVPPVKGAALLGGRLCSLWGQKVALTFYEARGKRLSLFIADRARFPSAVPRGSRCSAPIGDYSVCLLAAGETVFAVVGNRDQMAVLLGALQDAAARQDRNGPE
jgi:anti-sigma factor RsiW